MTYTIVTKQDEYSIELAEIMKRKINIPYDEKNPDIVISIGGDGTILKSLHSYADRADDITIFSINTGHLGFITNFTVEEIDKVAEMINTGAFPQAGNFEIFTVAGNKVFVWFEPYFFCP